MQTGAAKDHITNIPIDGEHCSNLYIPFNIAGAFFREPFPLKHLHINRDADFLGERWQYTSQSLSFLI